MGPRMNRALGRHGKTQPKDLGSSQPFICFLPSETGKEGGRDLEACQCLNAHRVQKIPLSQFTLFIKEKNIHIPEEYESGVKGGPAGVTETAPEALAWDRPGLNPGSATSWLGDTEPLTYFYSCRINY